LRGRPGRLRRGTRPGADLHAFVLWGLWTQYDERVGRGGSLPTTNGIPVHSVAFSPDGETIGAGSYNGTVRLWDSATQSLLGSLPTASSKSVYSVAFSPDGRTLAAGSHDGAVRFWDTATREQLGSELRANRQPVYSVVFSQDGHTLAAAGEGGAVRLWSGFSWRDFAALTDQVCHMVGSDLTRAEWAQYAPAIAYRESCR
jgi:WD40 repeat protein